MNQILLFPLLASCWHHLQVGSDDKCLEHLPDFQPLTPAGQCSPMYISTCPGVDDVGSPNSDLWVLLEIGPWDLLKCFISPLCHVLAEVYFLWPRRFFSALILVCPNSSVMSRGIRFKSLGNIHLMQDLWNKCVLTQMTSRGYPLHRHRFAQGCNRICAVTVMHPISSSSWPLPWAWKSV